MMHRSACAVVLGMLADPAIATGAFSFFNQEEKAAASTASATLSDGGSAIYNLDGFSEPASEFVGGTIDAFLGHSQVSGQERRCLSDGASNLASSVTQSFGAVMDTYKTFMQQANAANAAAVATQIQQPGIAQVAGTPIPAFRPLTGTLAPPTAVPALPTMAVGPSAPATIVPVGAAASPIITEGEEAVVGMELAADLSNLYRLQKDIAKSCLKGDMLKEFSTAAENLGDMQFVGGRLVANGADILEELSNGLTSYEHQNYRAFGKDMGAAWRKVALSKSSSSNVAEPSSADIEDVTQGLVYGFFGNGFKLQVMTDSVPAVGAVAPAAQPTTAANAFLAAAPAPQVAGGPIAPGAPIAQQATASVTGVPTIPASIPSFGVPTAVPPTAYPPSTLNVDLHSCIRGNMNTLTTAWKPVFELAESASSGSVSDAPGAGDFLVSMMSVQQALRKCNIGPAQEAMLIDAWEEGGESLKTKLSVPNEDIKTSDVAQLLSSAMEDFKDQQYYNFGKQLGKSLQDMVVVTFPMKYQVDDMGRLREKLLGASEVGDNITPGIRGPAFRVFGVASIGFLLFASLIVVRSRQSILQMMQTSDSVALANAPLSDLELVE